MIFDHSNTEENTSKKIKVNMPKYIAGMRITEFFLLFLCIFQKFYIKKLYWSRKKTIFLRKGMRLRDRRWYHITKALMYPSRKLLSYILLRKIHL